MISIRLEHAILNRNGPELFRVFLHTKKRRNLETGLFENVFVDIIWEASDESYLLAKLDLDNEISKFLLNEFKMTQKSNQVILGICNKPLLKKLVISGCHLTMEFMSSRAGEDILISSNWYEAVNNEGIDYYALLECFDDSLYILKSKIEQENLVSAITELASQRGFSFENRL